MDRRTLRDSSDTILSKTRYLPSLYVEHDDYRSRARAATIAAAIAIL
jgi:hypothetical protein